MSKCVTVSFLLAHIALILYITALATTYWFISEAPTNATVKTANSTVKYHKGLWEFCADEKCGYGAEYKYNTTEVQVYYRVGTYFYATAAGDCALAVILLYVAMMSSKCRSSVCLSGFISLVLGASGLEAATTLILLGSHIDEDESFPAANTTMFGWSYYVALTSAVVAFAAMLANVRYNCVMRTEIRQEGYERV